MSRRRALPPWPCPDDGELGVALQDGLHGREPVTTLVQSFRVVHAAACNRQRELTNVQTDSVSLALIEIRRSKPLQVSHQKSTNLLLHFKHVGVCWLDLECWRDAMEFA